MYPGESRSLPVPSSTWLSTTIGAIVEKYCWLKSAWTLFQRSLPVFASSDTKKLSGVTKYR